MVAILIAGGIIFLLCAAGGIMVTLWLQRQHMENLRAQQQAWERAQEAHTRAWEMRQEKDIFALKQTLMAQIEQAQAASNQKYETTINQLGIELELARLPRTEDTPVFSRAAESGSDLPASWRPAILYGANLSTRDLSHRYLRKADLRGAQLQGANLSMTDLAEATLSGANLTDANLAGANLTDAHLQETAFYNATLLVADLHRADFRGANLIGVRSLTPDQFRTTLHDETTLIDPDVDNTHPRLPVVRPPQATPSTPRNSAPVNTPANLPPSNAVAPHVATPSEESHTPAEKPSAAFATAHTWNTLRATSRRPAPEFPQTPQPEPPDTPFEEIEPDTQTMAALHVPVHAPLEPQTAHIDAQQPELQQEPQITHTDAQQPEPEEEEVAPPESVEGHDHDYDTTDGTFAALKPPETPFTTPTLDTLPFIEEMVDSLPLSRPASNDSLLDPTVTDLLVDTPENTETEAVDRAIPVPGDSGR